MIKSVIIITILLSTIVISKQNAVANNSDDDYDDDYYDDPEVADDSKEVADSTAGSKKNLKEFQTVDIRGTKTTKAKFDREELTTKTPLSKYEVTETVIDVPDLNTRRIPIITNFTVTKPLNLAGVPNNKTNNLGVNVKDEGDEVINSIFVYDKPKINNQEKKVKDTKNIFDEEKDETEHFDNFGKKDSFDNEFEKEFENEEDDEDDFDFKEFESKPPKPKKSLKNYFDALHKSISQKFTHLLGHQLSNIGDLRRTIHDQIPFLSKLKRKTSELVKQMDKADKRFRYHDTHDDVGYHDTGYHDRYDHDFK